jgi:hypothetical protein
MLIVSPSTVVLPKGSDETTKLAAWELRCFIERSPGAKVTDRGDVKMGNRG